MWQTDWEFERNCSMMDENKWDIYGKETIFCPSLINWDERKKKILDITMTFAFISHWLLDYIQFFPLFFFTCTTLTKSTNW